MSYLKNFGHNLHIVVMGASGGIGAAIIKQLVLQDNVARIYAASRSGNVLQDPKIQALHIDFDDEESIVCAAKAVTEPVDLVINATGFLHTDESKSMQPEKAYRQLNVDYFIENLKANTLGPALLAKHFLPLLSKQRKSIFAALSARVGSISDNRLGGWYSYRASKAALNMLIKNFAIEVKRKNQHSIIVGLHPGTVDTGLSKPFQTNVPEGKLFTPEYSAQCLLNVLDQLTVEDTGNCFAWDGQIIPA